MILAILLAVLSIWDYPSRQPAHDRLRREFITAMRTGDTQTMEETCRKGVKLLPDDPTWHFNLACSLAYFPKRTEEAFDELEQAIDLGFRDVNQISCDTDLKRLEKLPRYRELIEYAGEMKSKPLMIGPMASVDATGVFGETVSLGEQNLRWNFDIGCFEARLKLAKAKVDGNTGDLYMNRDGYHSPLGAPGMQQFMAGHPGLTEVRLDEEGRRRRLDLNIPNVIMPYPTFGNCSMAYADPRNWRSIPRAITTVSASRLGVMQKMYLSNHIWVFPSNADTPPVGTNGDVFASITPYWLTSAGRSWSDLPLLDAALLASRSFRPQVKAEIVRRGMLAPVIMTLMRRSFGTVNSEDDYLSPRAHPTAIPPKLVDTNRLVRACAGFEVKDIAPLAAVTVKAQPLREPPVQPELIYAQPLAWSFVLRSEEPVRKFFIKAKGASEYRFVQTHGRGVNVKIVQVGADGAEVTIGIGGLSPTNRVDIAVFGRSATSGWGAPSYVSFARMDPDAPYSDPLLTFLGDPKGK